MKKINRAGGSNVQRRIEIRVVTAVVLGHRVLRHRHLLAVRVHVELHQALSFRFVVNR